MSGLGNTERGFDSFNPNYGKYDCVACYIKNYAESMICHIIYTKEVYICVKHLHEMREPKEGSREEPNRYLFIKKMY